MMRGYFFTYYYKEEFSSAEHLVPAQETDCSSNDDQHTFCDQHSYHHTDTNAK